MKALIIEGQKQVSDVLAVNLKSELGFEVVQFEKAQEALSSLTSESNVNLVIVRKVIGESAKVDGEDSARIICSHIYDKGLKTSVVVLGDFEYIGVSCVSLPEHFKLYTFTSTIVKLLNLTKNEIADNKLPDFIAVPITHFYLMNNCACDIYMKLKKNNFEEFVKRINAKDEFDKEAIIRYNTKFGLQEFFVKKDERHLFYESLLSQSVSKLADPRVNMDHKLELVSDSYEIAGDLIRETGVDEKTVKMAKATIESMKQSIISTPKFGDLLKKLMANPGGYAYKHSFLIAVFCPKILTKMEWCPQSLVGQTFDKMVFISFFHDITLDDDKLIMINDRESFKAANLNEAQKVAVLNHASNASNLLLSFPHAPAGADVIIRQHHGMTNGIGFPEAYGVTISPMAMLFIVVETFVNELLNIKHTHKSVAQIISGLYEKYPMSSYKKIIDALRESLSKDF